MMKRLIPDTLAGRTLLALIFGLALSHAISIGLYVLDRTDMLLMNNAEQISDRIAMVDRMLQNSGAAEQLLELADSPRLHVTLSSTSAAINAKMPGRAAEEFRQALVERLDRSATREIRLRPLGKISVSNLHSGASLSQPAKDHADTMLVSVLQPGGDWLNFTVSIRKSESLWNLRFGLSMVVMLLAVVILSALAVYYLITPLSRFARAARRLGADVRAPPLPEGGPVEIREATLAFNEMQNTLQRFVEDRTQMIAAIAHDLATPIARMRLRAEFVDDPGQYQKMLADLTDMERMVFSTLSFARDDAESEPSARVDLRILLQRICNDALDTGQDVSLQIDDEATPFNCHPTALRRALGNLIDNAVKHGKRAKVTCRLAADTIRIIIDDDGPGIPEDQQEEVFKPFHRLEQSRNRETGGTGLGMTVARSIIRAHGGDIGLRNLGAGGLRVEVTLPRQNLSAQPPVKS